MAMIRKKPAVGLDIGHHTIKLALVERSGTEFKVTRTMSIPTPPDTVKDGIVIDPKLLSLSLKTMFKAAGVSGCGVHIGSSGAQIFVRPVSFPKLPEATLRKSIRYEAGRYIPGSVDESYVDFEILGDADEQNMNVLLVSAPKELVNSRMSACDMAGLDVISVDIDIFASYRALIESDTMVNHAEETVALIDIGAAGANLCVVDKGVFAMVRSIAVGGRTLSDALKSYFQLSDEDAESGKSQLDVSQLLVDKPADNPPLRVIQPHIDDLVREARRSLNYFQSQQVGKEGTLSISRMILTGGASQLPGIAEYFEKKMAIPTVALGLADNPRFVLEGGGDGSSEFVTAAGLAMRSLAHAS